MTTAINPLTQQPFSQDELATVLKIANDLIATESEIATLEAALAKNKEKAFLLSTKTLPDAMTAIGLNSLGMPTGAEINVIPFYQCSVSDKDPVLKEKALKWLRTHGAASLVKHSVDVVLGVDAVDLLKSLRGFLNKKSIPFKDGQSVNAATLKSLMKEHIEAGKPFPMDIFKGYTGKIAKVAMPKK